MLPNQPSEPDPKQIADMLLSILKEALRQVLASVDKYNKELGDRPPAGNQEQEAMQVDAEKRKANDAIVAVITADAKEQCSAKK